jgi:uncharacterized membrane protein YbhN (UPF0104 family)
MIKKKISFWRIAIAVIISLISVAFIFYRFSLISGEKITGILEALSLPFHVLLLVTVVLLMLGNWAMEILKWKLLLKPRVQISGKRATASVISGISLGAITPNRIGEFAGRIFFLKDQDKIFGTVASFTGGFAQNIVTIFMGLICLIFHIGLYEYAWISEAPVFIYLILVLSVVIMIVLLMIVYLNLSYFIGKISHWKIARKFEAYLPHTADWSSKDLFIIFLYSFLRYVIFTTQYLFLLYIFGIDVPVTEQMIKIGLIFMLSSFIPSYSVSDIANRGSVSMAVFNNPAMDLAVAAASVTLWVINLALPGLIGNIFIIRESRTNRI